METDHITPQEWHKLPEETGPAYEAFSKFLALGVGRSLAAAWRASRGEEGGKTGGQSKTRSHRQVPSHWEGWHSRYAWAERAAAFDAFQRGLAEAAAREELKAELIDFQRRTKQQAQIFEQFCRGLQNALLPQLIRLQTEPEKMTARDCAFIIGKLAAATETWQVLEGNSLALPSLITLFHDEAAAES